jgi:predicted enzyme related to lactoylglutathione lyase
MDQIIHPTFANGKICYIEIPSSDIMISSSFYKEVFGWNIRNRGDGQIAFDDTVNEISGSWVLNRKVIADTGLLVYIMVDNIEIAINKIISHGGKIIQPVGMDAPEITARFTDPTGNLFGLYQEPGS